MRRIAPLVLVALTLVLSASFLFTSKNDAEAAVRQRTVVGRARITHKSSSSSKKPAVKKINGKRIIAKKPTTPRNGSGGTTGSGTSVSTGPVECGNGIVVGREECDDGNTLASDGCSSSCTIETGYICGTSQPTYCWTLCGDGKVAAGVEKCDDGNGVDDDGCSRCIVDVGYKCSGSPSACTELFPMRSSSSSS